MSEEDERDDGLFTCWCGAVGAFDEMFDMTVFDQTCGGSGSLQCECGGDLCICHNHGEVECPGCRDCEADPDDYVWDSDEEEEEDDDDPFGAGVDCDE